MVILRSLKKHREIGPFLRPVDPIALGIPTYFDVIKQPMDVMTIEKQLHTAQYQAAEDFISDFRLMLNNCFTFNPPDHVVHIMGRNVEKSLNNQLKRLPQRV
jgi:hypothetical protein